MVVKKLYRYKRADGGVTISPIKPDNTDYEITHRLIADTGMELVRNDSVNGIAVSQNGKSLYGSSSYVKPNAYSASIIGDGHGVNIRATMPNTTNATNNATCAITASIKITFS